MIRMSTYLEAETIYGWMTATNKPGKTGDAFTRFLWWILGLMGCVILVGSFGFLLMPWIAGWGFFEALLAFNMSVWVAHTFLFFPETWARMSAWLWLTKKATGGRGAIAKALQDVKGGDGTTT